MMLIYERFAIMPEEHSRSAASSVVVEESLLSLELRWKLGTNDHDLTNLYNNVP